MSNEIILYLTYFKMAGTKKSSNTKSSNTKTSNTKTSNTKTSNTKTWTARTNTRTNNLASIVSGSKNTTTNKNTSQSTQSQNAKAWAGTVAGITTTPKVNVNTTNKNTSNLVWVRTNADWSTGYANINTTNKNTNTTNKNTNTSNSSGAVSSQKNSNWTTTYRKANGDTWTENSKWDVVSKTVNGKTTNYAAWDKSWGIYQSTANTKTYNTNPVVQVWWIWNAFSNFINNTSGAIKQNTSNNNSSWKVAVATNADWSIRYSDGTSSKANTTSKNNTVASNWKMSYDYTKNNANWSQAVAQLVDGSYRYADGSTYNPKTWITTNPSKTTTTNKVVTSATNRTSNLSTNTSYNYKDKNANWSPAVQTLIDWSVRYTDGSIYNAKTWVTTDKNWNVIKNQSQATQVTEWTARAEANNRSNNSTSWNSSTYNPVSNNKVNNNKTNQDALSMVLKNQTGSISDWQGNVTWLKTKTLDTNKVTADNFSKNEDWQTVFTAPNGKQYVITRDEDWTLHTTSTVNWDDISSTDSRAFLDYLISNNQYDWINRNNVDNSRAVKWATIEWTYNAPNGKEYDILTNDKGQVWFVNIKWDVQWFDNQDRALAYIDKNNPEWSTAWEKNTIKPEWQSQVNESIQDMNENVEEWKDEERDRNEDLLEWMDDFQQDRNDKWDEIDRNNYNILNQSLNDWNDFQVRLDDAVADLEEKSKLVQDWEKMRWARQRAQQLADMGYLTSEQVAQVANYSLADYNRELEQGAREAAQAIAQLRIDIAQKANDALASIRDKQFTNENNRLAQINFVNEWRAKMEDSINARISQYDQTYNGLINSNLAMNAQNELGYESIIKQNTAQNITDERNQIDAFKDPIARERYILNQIQDVNLHPYVSALIKRDIQNNKFYFPNNSYDSNKRILAEQVTAYADAARQMQIEEQIKAAKATS